MNWFFRDVLSFSCFILLKFLKQSVYFSLSILDAFKYLLSGEIELPTKIHKVKGKKLQWIYCLANKNNFQLKWGDDDATKFKAHSPCKILRKNCKFCRCLIRALSLIDFYEWRAWIRLHHHSYLLSISSHF